MRVFDVLDMTGCATWRFRIYGDCGSFEKLGVMTTHTGGARRCSIYIGASVPGLMTTTARQYSISGVWILKPLNAGDDTNAMDVDEVELRVAPLLRVARICTVLFQECHYFRLRFQFFRV